MLTCYLSKGEEFIESNANRKCQVNGVTEEVPSEVVSREQRAGHALPAQRGKVWLSPPCLGSPASAVSLIRAPQPLQQGVGALALGGWEGP